MSTDALTIAGLLLSLLTLLLQAWTRAAVAELESKIVRLLNNYVEKPQCKENREQLTAMYPRNAHAD